MSMHDTPAPGAHWHPEGRRPPLRLFLSGEGADTGALLGAEVAGFPVELELGAVSDWIDPAQLAAAAAAVVQVDCDSPASIKRFERLAAHSPTPLIAAAAEPPLALVRALIRAGAHDVLPLPVDLAELGASIEAITRRQPERAPEVAVAPGRVVGVIRSEGGVGATAMLAQLAIRFAAREAAFARGVCVMDLDVQFGDAAFQLGLHPRLGLGDLLEAGSRVDGELVRSVATVHPGGLSVIAAPRAVLPLESFSAEAMLALTDRVAREYPTVFLDLPANWTNWSLSLLARCDVVLLVTELRLASLHRTRRLLDLLREQELADLDLRVIVNRLPRRGFKAISKGDVERVLGMPVAFTIADEGELVERAIERGVPIGDLQRKSALGRDLDALAGALGVALGREA